MTIGFSRYSTGLSRTPSSRLTGGGWNSRLGTDRRPNSGAGASAVPVASGGSSGGGSASTPARGMDMALSGLNTVLDRATAVSEQNRARFDADVDTAITSALRAAGMLDDYSLDQVASYMQEIFGGQDTTAFIWDQAKAGAATVSNLVNTYVNDVLPGLAQGSQEIFQQAVGTVSSLMAGDIPDDVQDSIISSVAERFPGLGADRFANVAARHLGLTSLDLMETGLGAAPGITDMAGGIAGLYTTGIEAAKAPVAVAGLLGTLRNTLAAPGLDRLADPSSLYQLNLAARTENSLNPNQVLGSGSSLAASGLSTGANVYGTDMNYQLGMNRLNQQADEFSQTVAESTRITNLNLSQGQNLLAQITAQNQLQLGATTGLGTG